MPPRAPTAYFIFAGEVREEVRDEIAAANNGKAPVAAVGKAIGQRWAQLTDEEKQRYKDLAAEKAREAKEAAARAAEEAANGGEDGDDNEAAGAPPGNGTGGGPPPAPFGLPTSVVKKIVCMDPDVSRIAADGTRAIAKAAQLFIELLATKAYEHAVRQKRKNFKFADIEAVAHRDRRFVDMGLGEFIEKDHAFAEIHQRAEEENQAKLAGKKAAVAEAEAKEAKRMRPLTSFFAGNSNATVNAPAE